MHFIHIKSYAIIIHKFISYLHIRMLQYKNYREKWCFICAGLNLK